MSFKRIYLFILIMALCTFQAPNIFYFQCILGISMKLYQFIIVFITLGYNLCSSVTINTPSHSQGAMLGYDFHFFNRTMAGLALYFTHFHMLRVIEISQIRKIMHPYPLYRRVSVYRLMYFCNFRG